MVVSDYTGTRITPKDIVAWCGNKYYIWKNGEGKGSSWSLFGAGTKHFNLQSTCEESTDINVVVKELQKGNLVISCKALDYLQRMDTL